MIAPRDLWRMGYKFKLHGRLDSDYATNPDDYRSVLGERVFLISQHHSKVRDVISDRGRAVGVMVAQDMLYAY